MQRILYWLRISGFFLIAIGLLSGCGIKKQENIKGKKLEYTVVEELSIPEELKEMIEEKKVTEFQISYADGEALYLTVGYGEQKTGGYSIVVEKLTETEDGIYLETNLLGPDKEEKVSQRASYPYIVIKTEFCDKEIYYK